MPPSPRPGHGQPLEGSDLGRECGDGVVTGIDQLESDLCAPMAFEEIVTLIENAVKLLGAPVEVRPGQFLVVQPVENRY